MSYTKLSACQGSAHYRSGNGTRWLHHQSILSLCHGIGRLSVSPQSIPIYPLSPPSNLNQEISLNNSLSAILSSVAGRFFIPEFAHFFYFHFHFHFHFFLPAKWHALFHILGSLPWSTPRQAPHNFKKKRKTHPLRFSYPLSFRRLWTNPPFTLPCGSPHPSSFPICS